MAVGSVSNDPLISTSNTMYSSVNIDIKVCRNCKSFHMMFVLPFAVTAPSMGVFLMTLSNSSLSYI